MAAAHASKKWNPKKKKQKYERKLATKAPRYIGNLSPIVHRKSGGGSWKGIKGSKNRKNVGENGTLTFLTLLQYFCLFRDYCTKKK